jgi:arylsulfatase A-like enzyme
MVDAEIGRVLTAIEDMGYMDNTLIVLNSDHGEGMGHHQWVRKSILYDEGAKVPLIFSLPGRIKANKINRENLVSGLDIMPTVCDYAGIEAPRNMRGMSLRKILEGKSSKGHEFVVSEASNNTGRMVRSQKYKYIAYYNDDVDQLFDIENDPGETKNLATDSKHAKVLSRHKKMLRDWETNLDVASKVPNMDAWWYQA